MRADHTSSCIRHGWDDEMFTNGSQRLVSMCEDDELRKLLEIYLECAVYSYVFF